MVNGKLGDNPLSDLTSHGVNRFPEDIKELLIQIDELGRGDKRWPLGENWPFVLAEFDWVKGKNLEEGRELLEHFIEMLEAGRGDEIMVDPLTQKPFK
jgi:hypothetical protein